MNPNASVDKPVKENTGTHFQNRYTYYYIPKTKAVAASPDSGVGAFFRLGGYSDEEQTQTAAQDSFYPAEHILDEGGAGQASVYEKAAGPAPVTSHGILLACDGRILVKAGEKMYVESGPFHQKTNGTHTIEAETDTVIRSANGKISIVSGTGKDILLDAGGDSKGDFQLIAQKSTSDIKGDDSTTRHGNTYSLHHGRTDSFFLGGKSAFSLAGSFALTTGIDLTIKVGLFFGFNIAGSFTVSAMAMSVTGANFATTNSNINIEGFKFSLSNVKAESDAAKYQENLLKVKISQISSNQAAIDANSRLIGSEVEGIRSKMGNMDSEISNIKSNM